jgi:glycosyltransferase involved in cell wall biosynthesis
MKILLVIDHLGLGGAQRQVVELGCGLKERGHAVEMFVYYPQYAFFRRRVEDKGIRVHEYRNREGFSLGVLRALSALMRSGEFDLVLSYLNNPNIYAELARPLSGGPQLVISERCSHHDDKSLLVSNARRVLHILADHIVTNSQAHAEWLRKRGWLANKVSCIYNGLDLDSLSPTQLIPRRPDELRLLAIGRICPQKNLGNLIAALGLLHKRHGFIPEIGWVGKRDVDTAGALYGQQIDAMLESMPEIRKRWHWLGEQSDIARLLGQYHALIHPSLYEGLPNVVCEALAAGMPVLASNVCDHMLLVAEGKRGFLYDPLDAGSIASAIEKLMGLDTKAWSSFSRNARQYAEANLGIGGMLTAYEDLFMRLVESRVNTADGTHRT